MIVPKALNTQSILGRFGMGFQDPSKRT